MTPQLVPPYVDPATDRGSYDTDELDAIEEAVREAAAKGSDDDAA